MSREAGQGWGSVSTLACGVSVVPLSPLSRARAHTYTHTHYTQEQRACAHSVASLTARVGTAFASHRVNRRGYIAPSVAARYSLRRGRRTGNLPFARIELSLSVARPCQFARNNLTRAAVRRSVAQRARFIVGVGLGRGARC